MPADVSPPDEARVSGATSSPVDPAAPGGPGSAEAPLRLDGIPQIARDMARRKAIAEQADEQVRITPMSPQEKLAAGVASGAVGDCLKGGPDGSRSQALGLFGLPLLAYDAISGKCRR